MAESGQLDSPLDSTESISDERDRAAHALHDVVETCLADFRHDGIDPEKPFSRKITVRVPPVLHWRVVELLIITGL